MTKAEIDDLVALAAQIRISGSRMMLAPRVFEEMRMAGADLSNIIMLTAAPAPSAPPYDPHADLA